MVNYSGNGIQIKIVFGGGPMQNIKTHHPKGIRLCKTTIRSASYKNKKK
jgi:hypothetical protein